MTTATAAPTFPAGSIAEPMSLNLPADAPFTPKLRKLAEAFRSLRERAMADYWRLDALRATFDGQLAADSHNARQAAVAGKPLPGYPLASNVVEEAEQVLARGNALVAASDEARADLLSALLGDEGAAWRDQLAGAAHEAHERLPNLLDAVADAMVAQDRAAGLWAWLHHERNRESGGNAGYHATHSADAIAGLYGYNANALPPQP